MPRNHCWLMTTLEMKKIKDLPAQKDEKISLANKLKMIWQKDCMFQLQKWQMVIKVTEVKDQYV